MRQVLASLTGGLLGLCWAAGLIPGLLAQGGDRSALPMLSAALLAALLLRSPRWGRLLALTWAGAAAAALAVVLLFLLLILH